jgi:hypothetical protein
VLKNTYRELNGELKEHLHLDNPDRALFMVGLPDPTVVRSLDSLVSPITSISFGRQGNPIQYYGDNEVAYPTVFVTPYLDVAAVFMALCAPHDSNECPVIVAMSGEDFRFVVNLDNPKVVHNSTTPLAEANFAGYQIFNRGWCGPVATFRVGTSASKYELDARCFDPAMAGHDFVRHGPAMMFPSTLHDGPIGLMTMDEFGDIARWPEHVLENMLKNKEDYLECDGWTKAFEPPEFW